MTDLDSGAWMVSGSSVLQNCTTIMSGYSCDLDKLEEGSRLGVMRKSDGTLHFFVNGEDCGVAATSVPSGNIVFSRSFLFYYFFFYAIDTSPKWRPKIQIS